MFLLQYLGRPTPLNCEEQEGPKALQLSKYLKSPSDENYFSEPGLGKLQKAGRNDLPFFYSTRIKS